MKTLATIISPAALTLALTVAAFLLPSQLTGQYELVSQKQTRSGYFARNYSSMPELKSLQLSILFSLARICLPFRNDQDGLIDSGMLNPVASNAVFCCGNSSADRLQSFYLFGQVDHVVIVSSTISDAANTYTVFPSPLAEAAESIEGWMLSSFSGIENPAISFGISFLGRAPSC